MPKNNYTIYHLHSPYSNPNAGMDCVTPIELTINKAKEFGMTSLAFSEHGNVFDWITKKEKIEAVGMKYIHAIEAYVTETLEEKIWDNYHVVLIAKNFDGVQEINELSSRSYNRNDGHFYYAPRISLDELFNTSDNIMITTACIAGLLGVKSNDTVRERTINFLRQNKDRCFLEIQHHCCQKQKDYNQYAYEVSLTTGVPLIAGTDTHSLDKRYAEARLIFEKGAGTAYPDEDEFNLCMLSYEDLIQEYERQNCLPQDVYINAIEMTNVMAGVVEAFELDRSYKYPKIYENGKEVLWQKTVEAYKNHPYASKRYTWEEIEPRLREEYEVMCDNNAQDFMLLQMHIRDYENANGINYGFGRGSVGGSEVAYVNRITEMDSIKYDLPFSRFMSRERVNLADIDTDYDDESKAKVTKFLIKDHLNLPNMQAAQIITFGTMKAKKAIEYAGKGLGYSLDEIAKIKKMLGGKDGEEITDEMRKKYPKLIGIVELASGVVVNTGIHASGILISDKNISRLLGLATNSNSDYVSTQVQMKSLDAYNWVKFDLLGLNTLKLINLVAEYCGHPKPTPDSELFKNMGDFEVYKSMREDTTMIFQYESSMAFAFIRRFFSDETLAKILNRRGDLDFFMLGAICNAALRPSGASYRDNVAEGEYVDYELKPLQDFLDPTFGRLLFQEEISEWLQKFAGYSSGEADVVRRAIAKKKGTESLLPEIKERFINTMVSEYGVSESDATVVIEPFLQTILDASDYSFSKIHSMSYHAIAYISAWYRLYYPVEWVTAALNTFDGNIEKTGNITTYAKKHGVKIKPIKFGESRNGYSYIKEDNAVVKGLNSIKSIGKNTGDSLANNVYGEKYDTFTDVLVAIKERCRGEVTSEHVNILIKLDFFSDFGEINALLHVADLFYRVYKSGDVKQYKNLKFTTVDKLCLPLELVEQFAERKTEKTLMKVDMFSVIRTVENNVKKVCNHRALKQRIADQSEYLGYIDIQNKEQFANMIYVMSCVTTYSPRLQVYCLANGNVLDVKIQKKTFKSQPLKDGDLAIVTKFKYSPKFKMGDDGKWIKDYKQKELWIESYRPLEGSNFY